MNKLFDPIRNKNIAATPEEIVRQKIIDAMLADLGYPKSLISVELDLSRLKHVNTYELSNYKRRADIICFAKNIHPKFEIYPLLLVECKACKLDKAVFNQVQGYNTIVKAYFYCVVNEFEVYTCWIDPVTKKTKKVAELPKYNEMLSAVNGV